MQITIENILKVITKYWKDENHCHQRLGQYLCNHFDIRDSYIFHERNPKKAQDLFFEKICEDK